MLLRDLINKVPGVMIFRLHLTDNDGACVDDDTIDYLNEHDECDLKVDTYGDWYVEESYIYSIGVYICPIDRKEE